MRGERREGRIMRWIVWALQVREEVRDERREVKGAEDEGRGWPIIGGEDGGGIKRFVRSNE